MYAVSRLKKEKKNERVPRRIVYTFDVMPYMRARGGEGGKGGKRFDHSRSVKSRDRTQRSVQLCINRYTYVSVEN